MFQEAAEVEPLPKQPIQHSQVGSVVQIDDPRLPAMEIEAPLAAEILVDLEELLSNPLTASFLAKYKEAADLEGILTKINVGPESEADHSELESKVMTVRISADKGFVICRDQAGVFALEAMPSAINLAHEMTHSYHHIIGTAVEEDNDGGFDKKEELNTIGPLEKPDQQGFTENAYRHALGLNLRAGHYGIHSHSFSSVEEAQCAFRNSLAMGTHFDFLSMGSAVMDPLYNIDSSASTLAEKQLNREKKKNLNHDVVKLAQHSNISPEKKAFALERMQRMTPFAQKLPRGEQGTLFHDILKSGCHPEFSQAFFQDVLGGNLNGIPAFKKREIEQLFPQS